MINRDPAGTVTFEWYAKAYPHEAAELDFPRYAAYVRTVNPDLTDEDIRVTLDETKEAP